MIVSIKNARLAEIGSQACVMMAQQKGFYSQYSSVVQ